MEERLPLRRDRHVCLFSNHYGRSGICYGHLQRRISAAGYIPPEAVSVAPELTDAMQKIFTNADGTMSIIFNQPDAVNSLFSFFFVGLEAFAGILYAVMLLPVTVEKTVGKKLVMIRARQKAECEIKGEVWVEPEIRAAEEQKQQDAEAEEAYRRELKERCEQKGLNYTVELEKHIEAVRIKEEKQAEKERLAKIKAEEKAKLKAEKLAAKLAKMTPEQRLAYENKKKVRAMRDEYKWTIERAKGAFRHEKTQAELHVYDASAGRIEELSLQIKSLKKSLKDENADTVAVEAQILKCQLEIKQLKENRETQLYTVRESFKSRNWTEFLNAEKEEVASV